jgi:predicted dehydrogenase
MVRGPARLIASRSVRAVIMPPPVTSTLAREGAAAGKDILCEKRWR